MPGIKIIKKYVFSINNVYIFVKLVLKKLLQEATEF